MSNASVLIIKFIVERSKIRAEADNAIEADAVEADDYRVDNVSLEDVETTRTLNKAEVVRTIDRGVVVGATFYDTQSSNDRAYREKRRRLSKRVVESVVVEPVIAESGIPRQRNGLVERNSSKTLAQAADRAVSEVVRTWERECAACMVQGYRSRQEHAW